MIKTITNFRSVKQKSTALYQMQQANEEMLLNKPDSRCNWHGNLTQEEIRQHAKECRQVHKVTAW